MELSSEFPVADCYKSKFVLQESWYLATQIGVTTAACDCVEGCRLQQLVQIHLLQE